MTVSEFNTFHRVGIRTNSIISYPRNVSKNSQLPGFVLSQNRNKFLHVGVSTAWLCDCPHQLSPLYVAEQSYDKSPVIYQDTLLYDGSTTGQTIENATTIACQNNLQYVKALDLYTNQHYFLTQKPMKNKPSSSFENKQIKTAMNPNTFTAHEDIMNAHMDSNQF